MSGYKRVNFYELCRLCATNQQKDKTHIFTEEGRKIQLQNKIQSCLSLTVCESDFLPKVVCSKCLRSLEVCYSFRQECVTSESMLSSYFKNFRYTEDFKKSGKVYIKDTTIKQTTESVTSSSTNNVPLTITPNYNAPIVEPKQQPVTQQSQQMETIPFYTLQLPTIVTNQQSIDKPKTDLNQSKIIQAPVTQPQVSYNLNTINLAALKTAVHGTTPKLNETLSNVVVNANGEVINIAQLVDFESLINQSQLPKTTSNNSVLKPQKIKRIKDTKDMLAESESVIKIDLTDTDQNGYDTGQTHIKYDKLPHIKSTQNAKYTYTIKVEEPKANVHSTVIFNPVTDYQPQNSTTNNNSINFTNYQNNNVYTNPGINIVTSSNNTNTLVTNSNICNTLETSTVNLNALNPDVNSPQNYSRNNYTNVISTAIPQNNNTSKTAGNLALNNIHVSVPSENVNNNVAINNITQTNVNNNSQQTNQKIHACDICHKTFKRKEHLYQHIKLHTGFRPYSCDSCNKSFMRKEHLLRHMTSHSGQKNFTCNICEKSFSRNDNLLKHKKTHDKQSSYTCEVCNKQFVMKHYYLAHKITHDDEKCNINQIWGVLKA